MTGEIPSELGSLSNLSWLHLDFNQLTGEIPAQLGGLSNLHSLYLSSNRLTGEIPQDLARIPRIEIFQFYGNAGLCVPPGAVFQEWLQAIPNTDTVPDCSSAATLTPAPTARRRQRLRPSRPPRPRRRQRLRLSRLSRPRWRQRLLPCQRPNRPPRRCRHLTALRLSRRRNLLTSRIG